MRTVATLFMACATSVSLVIVVSGLAELWTWGLGAIDRYEIVAYAWFMGPGAWLLKRWSDGVQRRAGALKAANAAKLATATPLYPPAA